jgi:hypothetical protein
MALTPQVVTMILDMQMTLVNTMNYVFCCRTYVVEKARRIRRKP